MNMRFFHVAVIVFLTCWCRNTTITGYVLVHGINANPLSGPLIIHKDTTIGVPVNLPSDDSPISEIGAQKPKLLIQPRILLVKQPVEVNVDESVQPVGVVLSKSISTIDDPSKQPQASPVIVAIDPIDSQSNNAEESETEKNLNKCAHTMCSMIYCQNNLPAIPSQGICCQRCVFNEKCNTSACPKYKCVNGLEPANLTAGECCDHCAPVTQPASITSTTEPKKTTSKPINVAVQPPKTTIKPQNDSSSSESSSSERNSSEEHDEKPSEYNLHPNPDNHYSRLIRLLTETLAHFRDGSHSHMQNDDHSSESHDN